MLGVDTATGEVLLAQPDTRGAEGLWGGYPLVAIDLHDTAYAFQFGRDPQAHLLSLWPQINRRTLEGRAFAARHLANGDLALTQEALRPMSRDEVARRNLRALEAVAVEVDQRTPGILSDRVPGDLRDGLAALLGPEAWTETLTRAVALAPRCAVLGVVMETGDLALFHVDDEAEGVWGVAPIAAFAPETAEALAAIDWRMIADRWARWRRAIALTGGRG